MNFAQTSSLEVGDHHGRLGGIHPRHRHTGNLRAHGKVAANRSPKAKIGGVNLLGFYLECSGDEAPE